MTCKPIVDGKLLTPAIRSVSCRDYFAEGENFLTMTHRQTSGSNILEQLLGSPRFTASPYDHVSVRVSLKGQPIEPVCPEELKRPLIPLIPLRSTCRFPSKSSDMIHPLEKSVEFRFPFFSHSFRLILPWSCRH
jgi:hypothetical protein